MFRHGCGKEMQKSRRGTVFGVFVALAAMLTLLLLFLGRADFEGSDETRRLIYQKDDELRAILDIAAKEPVDVKLEKIKTRDGVYGLYSADGKYFYFFRNVDAENDYGTLCRIEVDKLKKDEAANDSCIREIDSRVWYNFIVLPDGDSVLYQKKSAELWLYRGGETIELAESVDFCELTDDKKYVVYTERDSGEEDGDLYWMEISEHAQAEKIDSHVTSLWEVADSDLIVYFKEKDARDLYVAGINQPPSLVAEDVVDIDLVYDNSFYYEVLERREPRTELKQEAVDQSCVSLCHYQNGESEVICENVLVSQWGGRYVVYTKADDAYYCHITGSAKEKLSDFDYADDTWLSGDGKTFVVKGKRDGKGYELVQYTVGSDGLGEGRRITRGESYGDFHKNLFYYYDDVPRDERDLYCYDNGKKKLVAKDAPGLLFLADDGTVAGITGLDSEHESGNLTVFNQDGRGEDITGDVRDFYYPGSGA